MKCSDRSRWYRNASAAVTILAVTATLTLAPQRARAQCTGDCGGAGHVTVNDLITLMDIALGAAEPSACQQGIPSGSSVTISLIVQAINKAISGCGTGPAVCGNGVVDAGEDCDNGGTCIGGSDAGKSCKADSACDQSGGVCLDGPKRLFGCSSDADCPSSTCVHCKTFNGKGCAANCTTESTVNITLVPGDSGDGTSLVEGTSGLQINSGIGITVGIAFPDTTARQLLVGKEKDGKIPAVLPALTNATPGINVLGAACICLRSVVFETCGGTVWDKGGLPSINCSAGYTAGGSVCDSVGKPCTFVYGPDNGGAGVVGCDSLDGINLTVTQDSGGSTGTSHPPVTTMSDMGGPGSAVFSVATELAFTLNPCTGTTPEYGGDGTFCTTDDPKEGRAVLPQVLTTGSASATVLNADLNDGNTVPGTPIIFRGNRLSCTALASGSASGGALAGAFPDLNASPEIQDIVASSAQVAK